MKERLLRFDQPHQFVDIVQNQDIQTLVEVQKVVRRIFPYSIRILYAETVRRHV